MKRLPQLIFLLGILLCLPVYARGPCTIMGSGGVEFPGQSASSGSAYLVSEDFETDVVPDTTPPSGWATFADSGTANYNCTGVTPQITGNYSFDAHAVNSGYTRTGVTLPATYTNTTIYIYFKTKVVTRRNDAAATFFFANNSINQQIARIYNNAAAGAFTIEHGSKTDAVDSVTAGATQFSVGSVYHVWIDVKDNSGAGDGVMKFSYSESGVKPAAANYEITNGDDAQTGINVLQFGTGDWNEIMYDTIRVSTTAIGDNPS